MNQVSVFQRLRIILVEPSHPGNVGAVARAMKTMGFADLRLVKPRFSDVLSQPEAIAFASGAQDVLSAAQIVNSLDAALEDCHFVGAVSARLREFSPPVISARAFAEQTQTALGQNLALVFGSERYGLPNEVVERAHALVQIPANEAYSSLNLAQAVQLLCYECRVAAQSDVQIKSDVGFKGEAASAAQLEGMYQHLEQALIRIGFLDPDSPKKLMPRLRRMLSRTQLETEEVNILRGISKKILDRESA